MLGAVLTTALIFAGSAPAQQTTTTITTQKISDSDYVKQTADTDTFEIRAGEIAVKRSKNAKVRRFAQRMVDDHTASTKQLTKLLQMANVNIAPPAELDEQHRQMLERRRASMPPSTIVGPSSHPRASR